MIYTVTFNPSLDYIIDMEHLELGMVNRTRAENIFVGGKGINVSIVLNNLGYQSVALGFVAGFTGEQIEHGLKEQGCQTDFISIRNGLSRINVKLKAEQETEVNGQGPHIDESSLQSLYHKLDQLNQEDVLVLAGSIPASLPNDIYEKIMERLEKKQIRIIVDATKDLLVNVLKYHPFLIKPNNHELGEIFGVILKKKEEVVTYAKKLQEMGATNVLVSMAGQGAVFVSEQGEIYLSEAPKGTVKNSVGAGDSMVAGFLAGYLEEHDYQKAFRMGVATGSASAFSNLLATREEVEQLLKTIE